MLTDLPAGRYTVQASLCGGGSCYATAEGHNDYTAAITTQPLTAGEQAAADAAAQKAPVIGNAFNDLVLTAGDPGPYIVLVDARDENGDPLTLQATSTNPAALQATLTGNLLSLSPKGQVNTAGAVHVRATAGGQAVTRTLNVLMPGSAVATGTAFTVGGRFNSQDAVDTYQVALDGDCTISGKRYGVAGQAFFISVNGPAAIAPTDSSVSASFSAGIYALGASLTGDGVYYTYQPDGLNAYALTVSCPDADASTQAVANLLGVDLSGLGPWPGDVNASGAVDLADAVIVQQILAGVPPVGDIEAAAAIDGTGRIGPGDALHALQWAAGLH